MGDVLRTIRGIVFDLDDTLLSTAEWTTPALEFAASKLRLDTQRVWELATRYAQEHGGADSGIYNRVLLECGQSDTAMNIRALAAWANQYTPAPGTLNLLPGVAETLELLGHHYRLAVIAEGHVACQKAKVRATGLAGLVASIIYSDEIEGPRSRRPDPRAFRAVLAELGTRSTQTLFVGDNPIKDFLRPRELGWITVRVLSGEYAKVEYPSPDHAADYEISSFARLPALLADAPEPRTALTRFPVHILSEDTIRLQPPAPNTLLLRI